MYREKALRILGATLAISAVTLVGRGLFGVNPTTASLVYLVAVLIVGTEWGLAESVVASVLASVCLNYFFLPPVGTLTVADPQNWVALIAFLLTSLIASQLSERTKRRTAEAVNRQVDIERLYALGRAILLTDNRQPIASQIAREIARIYEASSVAIYDRSRLETHGGGPDDIPDIQQKLQDAAMNGTLFQDDQTHTVVTAVILGGMPIGSLAMKGVALSDTTLHALSNLVAIALERTRAQNLASRADAARQSEEFKSTLLDALAHEFKTPLTSIKAATSAVLSSSVANPDQQRDLIAIIDQEADRLGGLVTEALRLAQIEAGSLRLNRQPHSLRKLIDSGLQLMQSALEGRELELSIPDDLPQIPLDEELMQLMLRQLIDNAAKYSPPGSPIRISAVRSDGAINISVHNEGEALPESEAMRIFEKFYRGANVRDQIPGAGLGLAIAREIVQAHGGRIKAESRSGKGFEVVVSIPARPQEVSP